MLGAARTAWAARAWAPTGPSNPRREGTASTNDSLTWTASTANLETSLYQFGGSSVIFNSQGGMVYSAVDPNFMDYGTGEFTIEWWQYFTDMSGHSASCDLLSNDVAGGMGIRLAQSYNTSGLSSAAPRYVNIFARQQADLDYWTMDTDWTSGQWYFCVIQRKGTDMSFWRDGILQTRSGSGGGTRNFASSTGSSRVRIGTADGSNGIGPNALVDEICFSNTWRYEDTADNIPVPTSPFVVDEYTVQLLHFDGTQGSTTIVNATS
jgi:hypothetical protein